MSDTLIPAEVREGPPNDIASTDPAFFQELIEYLQKHALASVLGLQVLYDRPPKQIVEIVLKDVSAIMLDTLEAKYGDLYRVTGQCVDEKNGLVDFKGGQSYAKTTKGTRQVFVDGKALLDLAALKSLLQGEDII